MCQECSSESFNYSQRPATTLGSTKESYVAHCPHCRSRTATLNASLKIRLFKKSKNPTLKIIYFSHGLALALAALH